MTHSVNRRRLIKSGVAAATLGGGATFLHTSEAQAGTLLPKWIQELPRPPLRTGPQNLAIAAGTHQFHPWVHPSPTWGYGGVGFGGPVIEARAGVRQNITFNNQLGRHLLEANISTSVHGTRATDAATPRTTVHMHGALVKAKFDGHPEDVFFPGQSKTYSYPNQQEATHLWYHDHSLGLTRLSVYAGLAGQYLLRDNWDSGEANILGLPSGECEIPLMLQDKAVDIFSGKIQYSPALLTQGAWFPGSFADLSLVNGVAFPKITVARGVYRFRVLNAANTRLYALSLSNGANLMVIGNDQGMLNAPVPTKTLNIAPGERYDVLIDFSNVNAGSSVVVYNSDIPQNLGWLFGHFGEVMRFEVTSATGRFRRVPSTLRGGVNQRALVPPVDAIRPVRVRNVTLNLVQDASCSRLINMQFRVNNMNFKQGEPEVVKAGEWEQWNVINHTIDHHPFHVHMSEMRILGRQNLDSARYASDQKLPPMATYWAPSAEGHLTSTLAPPAPWESGKKDTVVVPANTVTRIMVRIPTEAESGVDPTTSFVNIEGQTLSGYMFHCHLLEHEDCDMMRPMQIVV